MKLRQRLRAALGGASLLLLVLPQAPAHAAPGLHDWDPGQRSQLSRLWIGSLAVKADPGNRFADEPLAVALGQRLFFDTRLSANGRVACASCHQPERYFTDGRASARGLADTERNTPTVVGASQLTWLFHDGRSDSLWSQALVPLEDAREHGIDRTRLAHLVAGDARLRSLYEAVFGPLPDLSDATRFPPAAGPVDDPAARRAWDTMRPADRELVTGVFVNLGKSLAAYQARLLPAPSRFDRYVEALLKGRPDGLDGHLSDDELMGLRIFLTKGNCTLCHSGPLFTDSGFHNVSVPAVPGRQFDWGRYRGGQAVIASPFNCRSKYSDARDRSCPELEYIVLEKDETLGSMKTPSLRNVSKTAPYMHAGQYQTLREVIEHYNDPPPLKYRLSDLFLDVDLDEREMAQLEAFLKSLDSEIAAPPELLKPPARR